ncbi:glycosyl transferase [Senna tora]|uniref:Glycosyl transferase n=1 Tax=Senna tora TaxID=362788 RepID=A0A834SUU9_9FABA|nr:glycosyl transferase [Senna tora]
MASSTKPLVFLLHLCIASLTFPIVSSSTTTATPTPAPWPLQFHSILFMNYSGALQTIDLWYDWPNGRNFNIIEDQLDSKILYDLEWNNGTSFFYTLDSSRECRTSQVDVGILRPNWMDGANYLGQQMVDGFLCNVWEKVDFIWYSEDVATKRPVHWVFYTGREAHVMTYEVGAVLEDAKWQAPLYCFDKKNESLLHDHHPDIFPVSATTPAQSLLLRSN